MSKRRRHDVVLNELHWLPMVQRVRFKLALIVFKCLHGLAPSHLTDDCVLVSSVAGRRPLRSADTRTLYVPRTSTAIGARNFAVAGPRVWKSLPPELRMLNCTVCTFAAKLDIFFRLSSRLRTFETALYKSAHYITLHYNGTRMERTHRPMTGLPLVTNHQPALLMMMLDHGQTGHLRRRKLSPLSSLIVILISIFVRYCVHVALLFGGGCCYYGIV